MKRKSDPSSMVSINIGGKKFCTTIDTLTCREPNSMLSAMFSGNHTVSRDPEKGYVFVDRDGKHFRHILNWLRDGIVPILSESQYAELRQEAEYYQLLGLIDGIHAVLSRKKEEEESESELKRTDIIRRIQSEKVRLQGLNLSGLDLSKLVQHPEGIDLTNANLEGANMKGANLKNNKPVIGEKGIKYIRSELVKGKKVLEKKSRGETPVFRILEGVDLTNAMLYKVNLDGANLKGADLTNANLKDANLYGANLKDADLTNANLEGANLEGANLKGADLTFAILVEADTAGSNMKGADLTNVYLEETTLDGANLDGANLKQT